jgi:hypothetical protein
MKNNSKNFYKKCKKCKTCKDAAFKGHLECLKYLHENGCPWDENVCSNAAYNGHLECLKYLHENECPWDENICSNAAYNGHLECLKYLHENGCPWDERTCSNAVMNGNLECLKYAVINECSWDKEKCLKLAIERNQEQSINFIQNFNTIKDQVADNLLISSTCDICLINKKCVAYQPCGHVSSCWSCAVEMKNCPHCHKEISDLFNIFFN